MQDNETQDTQETNAVESFKEALNRNMPQDTEVESQYETPTNETPATPLEPSAPQPLLVPPADMRQEERDAFLNPTPQNAHILQQYVNRRSYETRADYQRRQQEIEDARKVVNPLVDVVKRYEPEYVKRNLNIYDVARRAIEWDRAISTDPINAAKEWLETYGLTPQDLLQQQAPGGQPMQATPVDTSQYLTREEAERIADERLQSAMDEHRQNAVAQYNEMLVQSFKASKPVFMDPETGSQIESDMIPIVQALGATGKYSSQQEILETAYNYVIHGNPNYSGLVQKMAAGSRVQQQQQVAEKAKAAARSISGSPGTGTPRVKGLSFKENLERRLVGD
jgi:hypothetical protein